MRLYFATGTCSFAPHVVLRELEIPFTLVRYDMKAAKLEDGRRLEDVNEKGYVPTLELDSGERLTEVSAILQYLADLKPEKALAPPWGTMARYHLIEWLNFIATELHKAYWPLFHDGADIENKNARERLVRRFTWVQTQLGGRDFLVGQTFSVADAYLLTVLNWTRAATIDMAQWPQLKEYWSKLRRRESVQAALKAESPVRSGVAA